MVDSPQRYSARFAVARAALRILLVEEDEVDRLAFARFVVGAGLPYECSQAASVVEAAAALQESRYDAIISDYHLADGTALDVFGLAPGTAAIIVTSARDQDVAIRALKAGADDYVVKDAARHYLRQIPSALTAAIDQRRRDRELDMLSHAMMSIRDSVYITDSDDRIVFVNRALCETYGYEVEELMGRSSEVLWRARPAAGHGVMEVLHVTKSGRELPVSLSRSDIGQGLVVRVARDISERLRAEAELLKAYIALEELSVRDGLTGLYNRAEIERLLADETERARSQERPLAIILMDVDHFKRINDTFGHAAGDEVLRALGAILKDGVRLSDHAGRYGGEELVIVLPETDETEAVAVATRLRERIARHTFSFEGTDVQVTASFGVASGSGDLLRAADQALYAAKRAGRDRVIAFAA
jgi:diguanylate cyclase (GGDEF)-like protein/PAS domain S-box-containing protein